MASRPGLIRHAVNILAALLTLTAPVVPMVHAAAMARDDMACAHAAPTHHDAPAPHHPAHQHPGNCCEFCGTCCAAPALQTVAPAIVTAMLVEAYPVSTVPRTIFAPSRPPYLLPLPLGPPALLV